MHEPEAQEQPESESDTDSDVEDMDEAQLRLKIKAMRLKHKEEGQFNEKWVQANIEESVDLKVNQLLAGQSELDDMDVEQLRIRNHQLEVHVNQLNT